MREGLVMTLEGVEFEVVADLKGAPGSRSPVRRAGARALGALPDFVKDALREIVSERDIQKSLYEAGRWTARASLAAVGRAVEEARKPTTNPVLIALKPGLDAFQKGVTDELVKFLKPALFGLGAGIVATHTAAFLAGRFTARRRSPSAAGTGP